MRVGTAGTAGTTGTTEPTGANAPRSRRPRVLKYTQQHQSSRIQEWTLQPDRSDWKDALALHGKASLAELMPVASGMHYGLLDNEDLVAGAFERAMQLWAAGRGPQRDVRGYLVRSMRNRVVDELRSPRSRVVAIPEDCTEVSSLGDPERELVRKELRAVLRDALQRLPATSRDMLIEAVVFDRKAADIAAAWNTTSGNVSQRVSRAKQALRKMLQDDPRLDASLVGGVSSPP